jgi:hypothetical protein
MSFAEIIYPSPEDTNLLVTTAMVSNEKTGASPIARISKKIDFFNAFGSRKEECNKVKRWKR